MHTKLKVLLYSHYFSPSLGGVETVSMCLAESFTKYGFDCKVITRTVGKSKDMFTFDVVRNPDRREQLALVKWADVILFNGASLDLQPWILMYRKPFIWIHVGYQILCIDGLGWVDGERAPMRPFSSFVFHCKQSGIGWSIKEGFKLWLRRLVAKHLVAKNIAITNWMLEVQPLPRQIQIYNPFPVKQFLLSDDKEIEYDFLYLGRIVSEKGVSTLLKAFAIVLKQRVGSKLLIIGDGDWKSKMERLALDLNITRSVDFVGEKSGLDLVNCVAKGKIAVIPSEWYEPMGGVALELMAAGKNVIVSEEGGLKECVGDVGLTFPNGNDVALAECMMRFLNDTPFAQMQIEKGRQRINSFDPEIFVSQYIKLLESTKR